MEKLEKYRQLIEEILKYYASFPDTYSDVEYEVVVDRQNDRYLLLVVGWEKRNRRHGCVIHVDIIDSKFWIQEDGTEYGVAAELMDRGVPKEDIVLAFHPADVRQYTGFAVA